MDLDNGSGQMDSRCEGQEDSSTACGVLIRLRGGWCGLNGGSAGGRISSSRGSSAALRGSWSSKLTKVIWLTISSNARGWSGCSYLDGFSVGDEDGPSRSDIGGRIGGRSRNDWLKIESIRKGRHVDAGSRVDQS